MIRAEILTPWVGDGKSMETGYKFQVIEDYPVEKYKDTTGQASPDLAPNMMICEIVTTQETIDLIAADSSYQIMWSEEA